MTIAITPIGDSNGIILDPAHLKRGDLVNIEVHDGGVITLTPLRPRRSREQVTATINSTEKDYARTMKRLA